MGKSRKNNLIRTINNHELSPQGLAKLQKNIIKPPEPQTEKEFQNKITQLEDEISSINSTIEKITNEIIPEKSSNDSLEYINIREQYQNRKYSLEAKLNELKEKYTQFKEIQ